MTKEEIEQLKYIWAYMVSEGQVTTGEFGYYGGGWKGNNQYNYAARELERSQIIADINLHGVAWEATGVPEYRCENEFTDTNCPSEQCDCLLGTLVLRNGKMYTIGIRRTEPDYLAAVETFTTKTKVDNYTDKVFKVNHD